MALATSLALKIAFWMSPTEARSPISWTSVTFACSFAERALSRFRPRESQGHDPSPEKHLLRGGLDSLPPLAAAGLPEHAAGPPLAHAQLLLYVDYGAPALARA